MCKSAFSRKIPDGYYVFVPCGKCYECKARRTSAWSHRLVQEDKVAFNSHFITLTYGKGIDKDGVHYPRKTQNGFSTINKRDLQLFFKRLRKASDRRFAKMLRCNSANLRQRIPTIKYYAVGEYGGERKRPHYHIILFNAHIDAIPEAWTYGHIHYGKVSGASVGYTLKYISKEKEVGKYQRDDRIPEFSLMSKGIGASYCTPNMINWHNQDLLNRIYCLLPGNKKMSMPRYYKDRIYHVQDRTIIKNYYAEYFRDDRLDSQYYVDRETGLTKYDFSLSHQNYSREKQQYEKLLLKSKTNNLYEIIE